MAKYLNVSVKVLSPSMTNTTLVVTDGELGRNNNHLKISTNRTKDPR